MRAPVVCAGGVEQVGEHADAALLDLGGPRVLGVVDEVRVQVLLDDPLGLGLHPGRHERGEIAHRDAVEDHLLFDQPGGFLGGHADLRQLVVGGGLEQVAVAVALLQALDLLARELGRMSRRSGWPAGCWWSGMPGDHTPTACVVRVRRS